MKKIFWYLFLIIALVFIFFVGNGFLRNIPSRDVTWDNQANSSPEQFSLSGISDFFRNIFKPREINILVFGKPGEGFSGGNLADAIVLAHFNPDKSKVFLVSVPRDLWISDGNEQFKINEVIHKKKIDVVMGKIDDITGIKPDGYAIIDLNIVKEVVDYFGGVDVTLSQSAVDWVSGYTLNAGAHHLNGEDAVWLIRNRFNSEGDFFREKNQQQIIRSLFSKFKDLSSENKISFLKKFVFDSGILKNIKMDLSKITSLVFDSKISEVSVESVVLDFSTKLLETKNIPFQTSSTSTYISVLIPKAGFENYTQIQQYIKSKIK